MGRTLAEKVWDAHVVRRAEGEPDLLYIDLHLVHEVTSPQAFDGLRAGRPRRSAAPTSPSPPRTTTSRRSTSTSRSPTRSRAPRSRRCARTARSSASALLPARRRRAGHRARRRPAAGPDPARHDRRLRRLPHLHPRRVRRARVRHRHQRGRARARHPDAAAAARSRPWRSPSTARCPTGVTAKDLILAVIAQIGTGGGQGYVIEYRGEAIRALSMEARMTVCNMSIEAGARAGMIAPDETTFDYLQGRAARAAGRATGTRPSRTGGPLRTDDDATFDHEVVIDAAALAPFVTWGTNPGQGVAAVGAGPVARRLRRRRSSASAAEQALEYMGLTAGSRCATSPSTPSSSARAPTAASRTCGPPPTSCDGRKVADGVRMLVVPGLGAGRARRPRPRAWTRSSRPPAPSGAARAARCAWA